MHRLDIYKLSNFNSKQIYLTEREYIKAKRSYKKILEMCNFLDSEIENIKINTIKKNKVDLNKLKKSLRNFNFEYRKDAIKELNELIKLQSDLN